MEAAVGKPAIQAQRDVIRQIQDIGVAVLLFVVIGVLLIGFSQGWGTWQIPSLIGLGLFSSGTLVGFLFGIPRVVSGQHQNGSETTPNAETRTKRLLDVNTNLEQISDWLTKIIVGLGLVELKEIPGSVAAFATFVAPAFQPAPEPIRTAVAVTIYFPVVGFLSGYLMTRLYISALFARVDAQLEGAETQAKVAALVEAADAAKQGDTQSPDAVTHGLRSVTDDVKRAVTPDSLRKFSDSSILWVDDHPENNRYLIGAFRELGINVDTSLTTEDALSKIDRGMRYKAIITDMGRQDNLRAGYELLEKLKERKVSAPVLVYAGSESPEHRREAIAAGAVDSTNRPRRVFEFVTQAIR